MQPTYNQIEQAKELLRNAGYYTGNLWHVDDVRTKVECSDSLAQQVLAKAMDNEATYEQIWLSIDCAIESCGLEVFLDND